MGNNDLYNLPGLQTTEYFWKTAELPGVFVVPFQYFTTGVEPLLWYKMPNS